MHSAERRESVSNVIERTDAVGIEDGLEGCCLCRLSLSIDCMLYQLEYDTPVIWQIFVLQR